MVMLRELFPDWNEIDLVFALQETDGDVQTTIDRITEGMLPSFQRLLGGHMRWQSLHRGPFYLMPSASESNIIDIFEFCFLYHFELANCFTRQHVSILGSSKEDQR